MFLLSLAWHQPQMGLASHQPHTPPSGGGLRCLPAGGSFSATWLRSSRPSVSVSCVLDSEMELSSTGNPECLFGPWELQTSLSGCEDTWVELEEGKISCSAKIGRGKSWHAAPVTAKQNEMRRGLLEEPGGVPSEWRLQMTLLDKLDRPFILAGEVRPDEYKGIIISGEVYYPPRPNSRGGPNLVGEFKGYKLR